MFFLHKIIKTGTCIGVVKVCHDDDCTVVGSLVGLVGDVFIPGC